MKLLQKMKRKRLIQLLSLLKRRRLLHKIKTEQMQTNRKTILKTVETILGKRERKYQSNNKKMKVRRPMIEEKETIRRIPVEEEATIRAKDHTRGELMILFHKMWIRTRMISIFKIVS